MLNDSSATANSLNSYFKQVSYNKLDIVSHYFPTPTNNIIISYQDIHPRSYYSPYGIYWPGTSDGYADYSERLSREKGKAVKIFIK